MPGREAHDGNLQASIQRSVNAHAAVKAELVKRSDEDLEKPFPGGRSPLYTIQSMGAHDAYHCGQIRLLRLLQGIPAEPY